MGFADDIIRCNDASIFDVIEENIVIIDVHTFELLYMNDKACQTFKVIQKSDYGGVHCYEVMHHRSKQCIDCQAADMGEDFRLLAWRSYNIFTKQHFSVKDRIIVYKGRLARLEILVDITDQLRQGNDLKAALALETALSEAINMLYSQPELDNGMLKMFEFIGEHLQAERVFMFEKQGFKYRLAHEWCNTGARSWNDIGTEDYLFADKELWKEVFSVFRPYIVKDIRQLRDKYPADSRHFLERGIYNFAVIPIMLKGETIGFFGMDNLLDNRAQNLPSLLKTLAYFISASLSAERNRQLLETLSYTDAMTGVKNRNAYIREEDIAIKSDIPVGVIFLDLNGLKQINDRKGHTAGDRLIIKLAKSIGRIFRKKEIFRLGGDEFVVLCEGISEMRFKKRVDNLRANFEGSDNLSVSVGCSWCCSGKKLKEALSLADEAMYEEKRQYYMEHT